VRCFALQGKLTSANVADLEVTGGIGQYSGARGRIVLTTISAGEEGGGFGEFLYQVSLSVLLFICAFISRLVGT
jgi:hypothetical protein